MFSHIEMTAQCITIQTHITSIVSSLPGCSHTSLSMNHGQEKFPRNESLDKTQSTKSTVKLQADGVS